MTDLRKAAEMALKFCEDIGDLGGPYPYVNETAVVSDSRKVLQALRKALAQPEQEPVAWLPIETAPKDGTNVLVMYVHINSQIVHNGFWLGHDDTDDESEIGWWSYEYSEVSRIKLDDWMTPTHWSPLPKLKEKNT